MKALIVEDEFTSRVVLQKLLAPYGESHIAVNGREAVEVFARALQNGEPYDLVCLDIVLPEKDGFAVLREIRRIEERHGIVGPHWVKVIMTTGVARPASIMQAFSAQCEAYLIKPVAAEKLIAHLRSFGLCGEA
jgi:two-component system chemotaxis response regulator CheY